VRSSDSLLQVIIALRLPRCDEVLAIRHPKRGDGVPPTLLVFFIPYGNVSIGQRLRVEHDFLSN